MASGNNKKNINSDNKTILMWVLFVIVLFSFSLCDKKVRKDFVRKVKKTFFQSKKDNSQNVDEKKQYGLIFSDNFNVSIANQDDLGLSIVIAIDCSGSMYDPPKSGGERKYIQTSKAVSGILSFIKDFYEKKLKNQNIKLKIGIVTFSDTVRIAYELVEVNLEKINDMINFSNDYNNFKPRGYTAIGDTIEKSAEILMQSGTIFKTLIIVTDGENTSGKDPLFVINALYKNINNKSTKEFPVLTNSILVNFILFDIDYDKFGGFSNFGVGLTEASKGEEIEERLKKLFLTDITKLEAK